MRGPSRPGIGQALLGAALAGAMLPGCYVTHSYDSVREAPAAGQIESLSVEVAVVAGEVRIGQADHDRLYALDLRYCESHFAPRISRIDSGGRTTVSVGLKRQRGAPPPPPGDERNHVDLDLNRETPLDLVLDLGAGRHHARLGGLRLRSLDLASGSGRVAIDFDRPTSDELRLFRATVGPGGLRVGGLGYASPDVVSLSAGNGQFWIDLSGPWDRDGLVQLDVALGDVTLIAPGDLGLMVAAEDREADDLVLPGFARDDSGGYLSPGFDTAKHRITVHSGRGLGTLRVERRD